MIRILIATLALLWLDVAAQAQDPWFYRPGRQWWGVERRWSGDQMFMPRSQYPSLRGNPTWDPHGPYYRPNGGWQRGGGYPYRWGGGCYGNWHCGY